MSCSVGRPIHKPFTITTALTRAIAYVPANSSSQGLGIALVAAQKANVPVTLVDSSQASLDKGLGFAGKLSGCLSLTPHNITLSFGR